LGNARDLNWERHYRWTEIVAEELAVLVVADSYSHSIYPLLRRFSSFLTLWRAQTRRMASLRMLRILLFNQLVATFVNASIERPDKRARSEMHRKPDRHGPRPHHSRKLAG
jgi:hypothetical protein